MRLNWEIVGQAKPTMMARYQQEFCMKFTLSEQM